jgi:acetylornithine deacetylase/succinyl-diaminopimelate desuccinylase-like protein
MDPHRVTAHVDESWDRDVVKALHDYIRIPNVSLAYDPNWAESGHMDQAVDLLRDWCLGQCERELPDATVEVCEIPGRTPVLLIDVPAHGLASADNGNDNDSESSSNDVDTVLLYGHLDKQPPFDGWREGLGPWEPVLEGDRLYGRGAADDGYAVFAALTAIAAVRANGGSHQRCLVLIEASEESGSPDLPTHLDALTARGKLGRPSLVVVLDSSCADYIVGPNRFGAEKGPPTEVVGFRVEFPVGCDAGIGRIVDRGDRDVERHGGGGVVGMTVVR